MNSYQMVLHRPVETAPYFVHISVSAGGEERQRPKLYEIERVPADNRDGYARLFDLVTGPHFCFKLRSGPIDYWVGTVSAALETKPAGAGGAGNFVQPAGGREPDRRHDE